MAKHYEFEGTKYVKYEDHQAELGRSKDKAIEEFKGSEDFVVMSNQLKEYKHAEGMNTIKNVHLTTFKVKDEYKDDVIKLTGISPDMEEKDIKKTLNAFSTNQKYSSMFNIEDSNDISSTPDTINEPAKPSHGGGSFWDKFKK